jgi:hypothetical protein
MRRTRQENSDGSTFQTFTGRVEDIGTMETEAAKGGTWRTMETAMNGGAVGKGVHTWKTMESSLDRSRNGNTMDSQDNMRLSSVDTWNAASFNMRGGGGNDSGGSFIRTPPPGAGGHRSAADNFSECSTPERVAKKPVSSSTKPNALDTLRNQLGTLRVAAPAAVSTKLQQQSSSLPSGVDDERRRDQGATLKSGFKWDPAAAGKSPTEADADATTPRLNEAKNGAHSIIPLASGESDSLTVDVPFLVTRKFDSNVLYADESGTSLPPIPTIYSILTHQEGSLKFDRHEIEFKMAIYGTSDGGTLHSKGCRMEIKFGNIE